METNFPEITMDGAQIDAKQYVEPGTRMATFIAFFVAIIGTLFGILISYGILLIVLLFYPLIARFMRRKAMALIHGSGIRAGTTQFPQIYKCAETFRSRLGIKDEVAVYIVEDNIVNAMAVKYGKKNVILLTDDIIYSCLASGNPGALSFVIAHEMAHIALKHTGVLRSWMSNAMKKLGRLHEYSADSVANALVGDKTISFTGLLLITVGFSMVQYVNLESIVKQAQEVAKDKYSVKAERPLTHPLLLNRLYRIIQSK